MDATTAAVAEQNKRLSRYRSVRKAAIRDAEQPPVPVLPEGPLPLANPQGQHAINRTPSRYHRKTVTSRAEVVPSLPSRQQETPADRPYIRPTDCRPLPTAVAKIAREIPTSPPIPTRSEEHTRATQPALNAYTQPPAASPTVQRRTTRYRSRTTATPRDKPTSPSRSYDAAREEARMILEGETDRLARLRQQQEILQKERRQQAEKKAAALKAERAETNSSAESEPSKSLTSRARKWTIGGSSSNSSPVTAPSTPPAKQGSQSVPSSLSRKVSQIIRRPRPEESADELPPLPPNALTGFVDQPVQKKRERRPTTAQENAKLHNYEPKAGNGPPKTAMLAAQTVDAPVSAVNAGDRRVEVRFEKSKITLPVTPSTTVRELLNSASTILSQPINPRTAVLLETYYPLGLERPLRRYERVRDVMNSWDSDTQNYLMITPETECAARGLEQKEAPPIPPPQTVLNLHHSQKPGKWDNQCIILKEDGQVTACKHEKDINVTNLFHLSDFDVYMPTRKEMKKIKPPKKICFAIKSQQRSIVFESTKNFVHYFSTSDKVVADRWYNAVQEWRSWYLVNILDQGGAAKPPPTSAAPMGILPSEQRPSTSQSRDSIPYQLGTFQPLLEFSIDAFKYGEEEELKRRSRNSASLGSNILVGQAQTQAHTKTNTSPPQRATTTKRTRPPPSKVPKVTPEASQNEIREFRAAPLLNSTEAGFTGKGLLARAFSVRKTQAEESTAMYDNTDNAFTGKGLLARKMSTKKFGNDSSVAPENSDEAFTGSGLLARKTSTKKFNNENTVPENTNDAFTGKGLIARSVTKKRSIVTRPGQPLVDLSATSEFLDRSLLRNVEAYEMMQGQHLPVIDRSRAVEVNVKMGEV